MSNMSSFYGGRTATPFTIVKRFDGISLAENIYGKRYYAVVPQEKDGKTEFVLDIRTSNLEDDNVTIIEGSVAIKSTNDTNTYYIIEKTGNNFRDYQWESFSYSEDGITIGNKTYILPKIEVEGMLQCFNKGSESTNEVNYGEYVIIDTVTNFNQYSNPDNGKIFRRGFNADNGMAGAEYVGKIVGPQGFNSGIEIDSYKEIVDSNFNYKNSYNLISEELLPGDKNNTIQCISANYMDEDGNVLTTKIGFKFPYLMNSFTARRKNPYTVDDTTELIKAVEDKETEDNPFYRKWHIDIPYGKNGQDVATIRTQPTVVPAGVPYYNNLTNLINDISANNNYANKTGNIESKIENINPTSFKIYNNQIPYIFIDDKYIDSSLCTNKKIFCIYKNYEIREEGTESDPIEVGDVNSIFKTELTEDGTIKFYYDNGEDETAQNKIRWINDVQINSSEGENQKIKVTYNTFKNGKLSEEIGSPLNFIKELHIGTEDEHKEDSRVKADYLYVRYSDPKYYSDDNSYVTIGDKKWVEIGVLTPTVRGLKIIDDYPSLSEVGNKPPEELANDVAAYGGVITIAGRMHVFDYSKRIWKDTGVTIGTAQTIFDDYIATNTDNDNKFLINSNKTLLSDTLPLKLNQEEIISSSSITDFNSINKQGIYSIFKDLSNKPSSSCINSNLIVLKSDKIIYQIYFKDNEVYSRQTNNSGTWKAWEKNIGTNFTSSSSSSNGTRGLVPAPPSAKTDDNYFLKSNANWINLNGIFARLGQSESFTGIPTFKAGFTSEGKTASTFANTVSITVADPANGKALSVTNGIYAGGEISAKDITASNNITATKDITADGIIEAKGTIKGKGITSSNGIDVTAGNITLTNGYVSATSLSATTDISASGNISAGETIEATGSISGKGITSSNGIDVTTGGISVTNGNISITEGNISTGNGTISATGNITTSGGSITASSGNISASTLNITSTTTLSGIVKIENSTEANTNNTPAGALQVTGGIYAGKKIYARGGVYGAVWNDLADSIPVDDEAEIEPGYCYCIKNNKYLKSSKYMDTGIIGIHSDTYGFQMGGKPDCKQLDCAVSGFVLAYVDKEYLPGTALTCTKDGRLTKMKFKDKQKYPERIVATYWKDEPNEEWGSDTRKVKVNGRKWVKIK